jgi:hypothetical protein
MPAQPLLHRLIQCPLWLYQIMMWRFLLNWVLAFL